MIQYHGGKKKVFCTSHIPPVYRILEAFHIFYVLFHITQCLNTRHSSNPKDLLYISKLGLQYYRIAAGRNISYLLKIKPHTVMYTVFNTTCRTDKWYTTNRVLIHIHEQINSTENKQSYLHIQTVQIPRDKDPKSATTQRK